MLPYGRPGNPELLRNLLARYEFVLVLYQKIENVLSHSNHLCRCPWQHPFKKKRYSLAHNSPILCRNCNINDNPVKGRLGLVARGEHHQIPGGSPTRRPLPHNLLFPFSTSSRSYIIRSSSVKTLKTTSIGSCCRSHCDTVVTTRWAASFLGDPGILRPRRR